MECINKILYNLGWPWGVHDGIRIDPELSEDYPVLLLRGAGCCMISLAPEIEEAAEAVSAFVRKKRETIDAEIETALFLIPGDDGVRTASPDKNCTVCIGIKANEIKPLREAVSRRDWMTGGVAPFARTVGVYDEKNRLVAVAGGRLQGDVLDLTVLTHPDARRSGYAEVALSAMIKEYPAALPLWRTEKGNHASVKLAEKMNFVPLLIQEGIYMPILEDGEEFQTEDSQ